MAYKKILAAIDLTDETEDVVARVKAVAEQNKAEVSLLTVVRPINQVYGGFDVAALSTDAALIERDVVKQAEKHLEKYAEKLGIPAERTHLGHGTPSHEIKRRAEEMKVDLIIMGTHGRKGLGLLLGSTASGVLHGSPCDVLTVRIK